MHRSVAALLLLLSACYKYQPPAAATPRDATHVNASLGQTWDAVIDLFGLRNIPIRTIERVSGIVATEGLSVDSVDGKAWADCGRVGRRQVPANNAIYNVLVRGDSTASSVRANVLWRHVTLKGNIECTSPYVWERLFESDVKARAEAASRSSYGQIARSAPSPAPLAPTEQAPGARHPANAEAAGRGRSNSELLRSVSFRQAVEDVQRMKVITGFQEFRPDTLTVELDTGAFASQSVEYNLGRLYLAYRGMTDYSSHGALELHHEGRRVGLYTQAGLRWER
jgi:hypothetical protein